LRHVLSLIDSQFSLTHKARHWELVGANAISNNWHLELGVRAESDHVAELYTKPQSYWWTSSRVAMASTLAASPQGWRVANSHREGVERSTAGIVYPMLTCMNYIELSSVMHVKLQVVGLREALHYGNVEYHDDRHVLAALLRAVPMEM
jgi:hypothetical protein